MKQENAFKIGIIVVAVLATSGVVGFLLTQRAQQAVEKAVTIEKPVVQAPVAEKKQSEIKVTFVRKVNGKKHTIQNGKDFGELLANEIMNTSDGHTVFMQLVAGKKHVIYDGKDLGEGVEFYQDGDNGIFIREIKGTFHIIRVRDGVDLGEVYKGQDYEFALAGDNIIIMREIEGKFHAFYNGVDQGEVTGGYVKAGENSFAFNRQINGKSHIIYNGKDIGEGDNIWYVFDKYVYYEKSSTNDNNSFFRNQELLGVGGNIDVSGDGEHYMLTSVKSGKDYGLQVSYDGGVAGLMGDTTNTYMENGHYAYYRDVNGEQHVIYDGVDVGAGNDLNLSENHIAFARKIGTQWHIIYDGKDLGVGNYPRILGENIVIQNNVGSVSHLFLNGTDLGECSSQTGGSETDDCWPDLSI